MQPDGDMLVTLQLWHLVFLPAHHVLLAYKSLLTEEQYQIMMKEIAHFAPAGTQNQNQAFWTLSYQVITQKMPFHHMVSFGKKTYI